MNDESIMPFGKHKGIRLVDVAADYLLWLFSQDNFNLNNFEKKINIYVCKQRTIKNIASQ